jgi:molybdopterin synthase sulfur carrier subunit
VPDMNRVLVRIPTILRSYTGGAAEVTATEGTLREVIAGLDAAYPGLGGRLLDDGGKLRRFVNVYVGEEDVRFAQGLDTQVAAGARVSVIPAVAGGAPAAARGRAPAVTGGPPRARKTLASRG